MGIAMQVDVSVGGLHVGHVLHHRLHCFSREGPFRGELWEAGWQPSGPYLCHLQLPGHYHVRLWRPGDHARDTGEAVHSWKDSLGTIMFAFGGQVIMPEIQVR